MKPFLHGDHQVVFEAFGVGLAVITNDKRVLARLSSLIPPGAKETTMEAVRVSFALFADPDHSYRLILDDSNETAGLDLETALMVLDNQLRIHLALNAPRMIFVHAGVVAHRGHAIVAPGRTFTGKTTLVLELVRAGATYYSDEYAVIDEQGLVHPYGKPLSIRTDGYVQEDHHVDRFGGVTGEAPVPIGLVVFADYRGGTRWKPARVSLGRAALAMFANAVAAQKRAEEAIRTIKRSLSGAVLLEGERGEAAEMVDDLLDVVGGKRESTRAR